MEEGKTCGWNSDDEDDSQAVQSGVAIVWDSWKWTFLNTPTAGKRHLTRSVEVAFNEIEGCVMEWSFGRVSCPHKDFGDAKFELKIRGCLDVQGFVEPDKQRRSVQVIELLWTIPGV